MCYINQNHMLDPEIWSTIDRIISHFEPFFALLGPRPPAPPPRKNFEKMKKTLDISSLSSFYEPFFFPFNPLTTQKIKVLKKFKKLLGDIIILLMCTIN